MFLSVIQLPHSRGRSYKKQVCPASLDDSEEIFWRKEARTISFYDYTKTLLTAVWLDRENGIYLIQ